MEESKHEMLTDGGLRLDESTTTDPEEDPNLDEEQTTTTESSSMQPMTALYKFGLAGEMRKMEEEVCVLAPMEEDQVKSLWTLLGDDVLFSIFEFLPCKDLVSCMLVSRTWFHVAADKVLWRRLYISRWMTQAFSVLDTRGESGASVDGWKAFVMKSNEHLLSRKNFIFIKGLHIWKNFGKEKGLKFLSREGHELEVNEMEMILAHFFKDDEEKEKEREKERKPKSQINRRKTRRWRFPFTGSIFK